MSYSATDAGNPGNAPTTVSINERIFSLHLLTLSQLPSLRGFNLLPMEVENTVSMLAKAKHHTYLRQYTDEREQLPPMLSNGQQHHTIDNNGVVVNVYNRDGQGAGIDVSLLYTDNLSRTYTYINSAPHFNGPRHSTRQYP